MALASDAHLPSAMTLDLPPDWAELMISLGGASWRRLVVLGGADAGKTSFCRLLCRHLVGLGQGVTLLDTDLGQKIVGPPACVTLARATADGPFDLERIRFVGEVNPALDIAGVIAATARLASAASTDRLVVNTSGLIGGPGIALKRWKLDALDPDHVVAILRGDELNPVLAPLPLARVHRLRPAAAARRKSSSFRQRYRQACLLAALRSCQPTALPGLIVEDLHRSPSSPSDLRLCGLADAFGEDRALGLVRWSDYQARQEVWTSLEGFTPHRLRLGMGLAEFGPVPGPFHRDQD